MNHWSLVRAWDAFMWGGGEGVCKHAWLATFSLSKTAGSASLQEKETDINVGGMAAAVSSSGHGVF
jgi:hypothetical protein